MLPQRGFILVELLALLAVLIVLLTLAIPSMQHLLTQNRVETQVSSLTNGLYYARSEAIARHEKVTFCSSMNQKNCGGSWRDGQVVLDVQGHVLRVFSPLPDQDNLFWNSSGGTDEVVVWLPTGYTNGQRGTFYYCAGNHSVEQSRSIVLLDTGRIYETAMSEQDYEEYCFYNTSK